ncbi:MAG: FAD-dependent oxidoreductase [Oscillospiraceae bacterium]|nr:FAD-dependent oxidoreductase [Oscillospiraceae bacterium]
MEKYDVIVAGGGPGGAIAAVAAARNGAKTLLIEQNAYLGGALTGAGTGPQMTYHAGETQVIRGIPGEFADRMKTEGFSPGHMEDFVGYASSVTPFDAEGMKLVLENMVMEAGAELLYHTVYTGCDMESGQVGNLRLFSKGGFFNVRASVYIDATADADLAAHAGVPTHYGRESDGLAQPMTMNMKVYGVDRGRLMDFVAAQRDDMPHDIPFDKLRVIPRSGIRGAFSRVCAAKEAGELTFDRDVVLCFETNNPGEYIVNMTRVHNRSAVDPRGLTAAEIEGRRQCKELLAFLRKYIPGFENCVLAYTGPNIGIRESRRIRGAYTVTADDLTENRMFDDAVAMGGYPIDIHSPDGDNTSHVFLKPGSWYSVPYRCLIPAQVSNIIVCGRCISASHEALAALRTTPTVMAIGQAAGTAAAMTAKTGCPVQGIDTGDLRAALIKDGAFLKPYFNPALSPKKNIAISKEP